MTAYFVGGSLPWVVLHRSELTPPLLSSRPSAFTSLARIARAAAFLPPTAALPTCPWANARDNTGMAYQVKEIFYTLQGEGGQAGRAAVFCRFAGCNLWSGREEDRASAICRFCDTQFVGTDGPGGGSFAQAAELADRIAACWGEGTTVPPAHHTGPAGRPLVVCTGGEPLLQLDPAAIEAIHRAGFEIAVETNGTRAAPHGIDWLCVSPKAGAPLIQQSGTELKLVYPQPAAMPEQFAHMDFRHFFLQPMDGPDFDRNLAATTEYCLRHPFWRLSLQMHKVVGLP